MKRLVCSTLVVCLLAVSGCGGSSSTTPSSSSTTTTTTTGSGNTQKVAFAYNGTAITPTVVTSAFLSGQVSVSVADGTRTFHLAGLNVTNTNAAYSVAPGNANSLLGEWVDGVGNYSTGYAGGTGTVTFTILQLGRVAGSLDITMARAPGTGSGTIRLTGTFDIPFP